MLVLRTLATIKGYCKRGLGINKVFCFGGFWDLEFEFRRNWGSRVSNVQLSVQSDMRLSSNEAYRFLGLLIEIWDDLRFLLFGLKASGAGLVAHSLAGGALGSCGAVGLHRVLYSYYNVCVWYS